MRFIRHGCVIIVLTLDIGLAHAAPVISRR